MSKDYPYFKSWKKLERYCKKTKTKCYLNDVESGAACYYCYIRIRGNSKDSFFKGKGGYRKWRSYKICLQCYKKEKKRLIFWVKIFFFIYLILFGIIYLIWLNKKC